MMPRGLGVRLALGVALGGVLALAPSIAEADVEAKARCKASYETAQVLRRDERLEAARAQLEICRETCPAPLVSQCAAWESEIEALVPTVRVVTRDRSGAAVADVRVLVDGRVLAPVDGTLRVDPGTHVFRFEPREGRPVETREEIHAGERDHLVAVTLEPAAPAPARSGPSALATLPPPRSRTPSFVLGGIGAVTLAVAGGLAIKGHVDRSDLDSSCAPFCADRDVDAIRTTWWASAGLAAVGTLAVLAAVYLWPRSARTTAIAR